MAEYNVRGYYLDKNGRRGELNFKHHHTDRAQIRETVRMNYPAAADQIHLYSVNPVNPEWTPAPEDRGNGYTPDAHTPNNVCTTSGGETKRVNHAPSEGEKALATLVGGAGMVIIGGILALHAAPYIGALAGGWGMAKATKGNGASWKRFGAVMGVGALGFMIGGAIKANTVTAWAEEGAKETTEQVAPAPAPAAEAPVFVPAAPAAAPAPIERTAAPAVRPVFEVAPAAAPAPAAEAMPWETDEDLTGNDAFVFHG